MSDPAQTSAAGIGGTLRPRDYTAIIYFHGIGTPRRHEEISRLADSLDQYAEKQDFASVGRLRKIDVQWEPARAGNRDDVAFVEMTRIVQRFKTKTEGRGNFRQEGSFRLYEGYWSSALAGGFSVFRVVSWLLVRIFTPFQVILTPWRAHQRLKLLSLYRLIRKNPQTLSIQTAKQLEERYKQFEGWPSRREYPRGSFGDFMRLLEKWHKKPEARAEIVRLAKQWRQKFIREQALAGFVSITLLAALSAMLILAFRTAASVILLTFPAPSFSVALLQYVELPGPRWLAPLLAIVLAVGVYQLRHYIRYFLADVMFWTMHEEKDKRFEKRTEVVDAAENVLLHVLRDSNCKRIVVVGHSLGSAIAYNALIRVGRRDLAQKNAADNPISWNLNRISHFITLGSPIDIIHYLFDLHQSRYHRFNRIQERLLGSISDPPFQMERKRNTAWINIWDDGDPISSRLFSPRKSIPNESDITDLVSRSSVWPNPLAAHLNYLLAETAIRVVFWIGIIGRMPNTLPEHPGADKWIPWARFAAKIAAALMGWFLLGALLGLVPWEVPLALLSACIVAWAVACYVDERIDLVFDKALKS